MKSIKRVSVIGILVLISFLLISCDKNEEMSEFKTYTNAYYTMKYPSNWLESEEGDTIVFTMDDISFLLRLRSTRLYENYLEESVKEIEKDVNIEECTVSGIKGYKIKPKETNEIINTFYYVQEKDMLFEMNFQCQANEYDNYQSLMEEIKNSFEINDFESLGELENLRSPKVNGDRDTKWLADIEFIAQELPKNHKNLFFKVNEEDFSANVESIKEKIPSLTDDELIVEVSKLIASVGDSHTVYSYNCPKVYPFMFYYFDDGVYLLDTIPEYSEFIGFKLISVNDKNIEEIEKLYKTIISHENELWFKKKFADYLILPEFLNGLKITNSQTAKFTFSDEEGNEISIMSETRNDLNLQNDNEKMLYLKNSDKNYWFEYLEDEKLLYFKYNACVEMKDKSFSDFNEELFHFIDDNDIDKFVIDLRNNSGGSSHILDPFFSELKKRETLNQSEKLFVIVGRETFSSAMLNTTRFDSETDATFIGEPTGSKPKHYGQVMILELSNTNSIASYSTKYFDNSSNELDSFIPEIIVEPNAEDYFNNIDPVMQRILEIN